MKEENIEKMSGVNLIQKTTMDEEVKKREKSERIIRQKEEYDEEGIWWGVPPLEELENSKLKAIIFRFRIRTSTFAFSEFEKMAFDITLISFILSSIYLSYKLITLFL